MWTSENRTLREFMHSSITPVPCVIVAWQMTTLNVEMSRYMRETTGLMEVTRAAPAAGGTFPRTFGDLATGTKTMNNQLQ